MFEHIEPYAGDPIFALVDAFNADMPYDTLVMAHLAADQMPEPRRKDLLPALGFLGQGPWYYDLADPPVARAGSSTTVRSAAGADRLSSRTEEEEDDVI